MPCFLLLLQNGQTETQLEPYLALHPCGNLRLVAMAGSSQARVWLTSIAHLLLCINVHRRPNCLMTKLMPLSNG